MKRKIYTIAAIGIALSTLATSRVLAQAPVLDWVHIVGRAGYNSEASASAVDAAGNLYVVGYYTDTMDFDPGAGSVMLYTTTGIRSMFVTKTSPAGTLIWAKGMSGTDDITGLGIAVTSTDTVFITGGFEGTADFDPGPSIANYTSVGGQDYFSLKLDPSGNYVSASSSGSSAFDRGEAYISDAADNRYVAIRTSVSASDRDMIIAKANSAGVTQWSVQASGPGECIPGSGRSMVADAAGNVYITGYFNGLTDFGPGTMSIPPLGVVPPAVGPSDLFIVKIAASGTVAWAKTIGGTGNDGGVSITIDPAGNIYTCGYFSGTTAIDFNPGTGIDTLKGLSTALNGYILKLDPSGNFIWAKHLGSGSRAVATAMGADNSGNIYVAGSFQGTLSLPWGGVTHTGTNTAIENLFLIKMDTSGSLGWSGIFDNTDMTGVGYFSNLSISPTSDIYLSGRMMGTIDFDLGAGSFPLTSVGNNDMTIVKLKQCLLNDAVTLSGTTLTATMTGATYQWINCVGNTPVAGATNRIFTPAASGSYAVIVSSGGCADTSVCTSVTVPPTGVTSMSSVQQLLVYPNPAEQGALSVQVPSVYNESVTIVITNVTGQKVYEAIATANVPHAMKLNVQPGIYVIQAITTTGTYNSRITVH